ncbi:MAG: DNA repair protein RadA [Flavobacteriales bacterium]|nr:DNA repair protein RadA [Flavobacteriales bacterium]
MAKVKTKYVCQNCGATAAKWIGKCPSCNEWNTYVEESVQPDTRQTRRRAMIPVTQQKAAPLQSFESSSGVRTPVDDQELDRVLGGGLVPGSLILCGGEPGIGKSTLLLQTAMRFSGGNVLYVSGEESPEQIKMRAERIGPLKDSLYVLPETNVKIIAEQAEELNPSLIIVDSIQTLFTPEIESSPGSVSQIRETAADLLTIAKTKHIPVFLIGHITKEGSLAGPKVLEHMVDVVLQFEGDRFHAFRILRTVKNRFGSTHELGIYEMNSNGLQPVLNPSAVLIGEKDPSLSGSAIAASLEGMRPLLLEIQALVSTAVYGTPQRSATGYNTRRLNMLLAVLEKRCGFKLGMKDVFLNIAGGLRIEDPAIDLAVVAACLSSSLDIALPSDTVFAGEIGLSGEIRPVSRIEQRISEAEKMGFKRMLVSSYTRNVKDSYGNLKVVGVEKVADIHRLLF